MPDPSLAMVVAQAAAKAATGVATKAAVPALTNLVRRAQLDPKAVRLLESYEENKTIAAQSRVLRKFILSRECESLLAMYSFLQFSDAEIWDGDRVRIRDAFVSELSSRLTLDDRQLAAVTGEVWGILSGAIRLHVADLEVEGSPLSHVDRSYISGLVSLGSSDQGTAPLAATVQRRYEISAYPDRASSCRILAARIATEMQSVYANVEMPHAKRDFRIPIDKLYVHRNLRMCTVDPKGGRISPVALSAKLVDFDLRDRRMAVIGPPGAGKSTFVRYIVFSRGRASVVRDELNAPILIELKRLDRSGAPEFADYAAALLSSRLQGAVSTESVRDMLTLGYSTVIFDGLDEVADLELRRAIASRISTFTRQYPLVQCVVTSRREGYLDSPIDPDQFNTYELLEFGGKEVQRYVHSWFAAIQRTTDTERTPEAFLSESDHLKDLRQNPLMLSLLCMLYEYEGWIPENRLQVYEECASLMFQRWDRVRNVKSVVRSDREIWQLFHLLGHWMVFGRDSSNAATESEIKEVLRFHFAKQVGADDLALIWSSVSEFLEFCAGRTWLLTAVGRNIRGERLFDFSHRTFMEYFAACHLSRQAQSASSLVDAVWPLFATGKSLIVPQLALQQFDMRTEGGFDACMIEILDRGLASEHLWHFLFDLFAYIQPSRQVLNRVALEAIEYLSISPKSLLMDRMYSSQSIVRRAVESESSHILAVTEPATDNLLIGAALAYVVTSDATREIAREATSSTREIDTMLLKYLPITYGEARVFARRYPQAILALMESGFLDLYEFLELLGEASAISVVAKPNRRLFRGPSLAAFERSDAGEVFQNSTVVHTLERIAVTGQRLIPLSRDSVRAVESIAKPISEARLAEGSQRAHLVDALVGYEMLLLSATCAAFDLQMNWRSLLNAHRPPHGAPRVGSDSSSRVRLAEYCEYVANRHQLPSSGWPQLFSKWKSKSVRFGLND